MIAAHGSCTARGSTRRRRRLAGCVPILVGAALLATGAHADSLLYYHDEEGRLVVTNTPSRPDVRVLPGFEERVSEVLRGTLPVTPYDRTIEIVARRNGLSPDLVKAVALVESNMKPDAVSPKGAMGLMQLMPATAEAYGVEDPFDPDQSLAGGAALLRDLLREFRGDVDLALAAYNAGSGAVRRYGGIPAYRETRNYVKKVQAKLEPERRVKASSSADRPRAIRIRTKPDGTVVASNL